MSWAGLASNQIVSDTNLADAVNTGLFAAKTSIPSTGRELTSSAAQNYAYVDVSGGRASNQLVTKGSLSASSSGPGPYNYYVYGVNGGGMFKSTNGGYTYAALSGLPYQGPGVYTTCAANSNGQYLIAASNSINNTVWVSTDYGSNFYSVNMSGSWPYSFYPINVDVSASGQYMAIVGKSQPSNTGGYVTIAVSSNYGSSFTTYTGAYQSGRTATEATVSVSGDGSTMIYVAASTSTNNSWRYYSTNYGSSFSYGGLSTNQLFTDVSTNYSGQYIFITNRGTASTGNLFISTNYGSSFASRSTQGGIRYIGMSDGGDLMYGISANNNYDFLYSSNYGTNWNSYNIGFWNIYGMAVGTLFQTPLQSNYVAVINTTYLGPGNITPPYLTYKPPTLPSYLYGQSLTYDFSLNYIYKRAYPV